MADIKSVLRQEAGGEKVMDFYKDHPPDDAKIVINGDKVIAFANAVKDLGRMFEELDIVTVHKMFRMGTQIGSIEHILELDKIWCGIFKEIGEDLEKDRAFFIQARQELTVLRGTIKSFGEQEEHLIKITAKAKELLDVCDRLQKHKESGILDLLLKLKDP